MRGPGPTIRTWAGIAGSAFVSGTWIGWTVENVPLESLTVGDWIRSLSWTAVAFAAPVAASAALASDVAIPSFVPMLGRGGQRPRVPLQFVLGGLLIAVVVLAVQAALGLVFDPRYRDFPFAPLLGATIPLLAVASLGHRLPGPRPIAQTAAAAALALAAIYIVPNETIANWQAMWVCGGLVALAITLLAVRDAPG
jgi:glucan 1,3-beta-glucosidase